MADVTCYENAVHIRGINKKTSYLAAYSIKVIESCENIVGCGIVCFSSTLGHLTAILACGYLRGIFNYFPFLIIYTDELHNAGKIISVREY